MNPKSFFDRPVTIRSHEQWRILPRRAGGPATRYWISDLGRIFSCKLGRFIRTSPSKKDGYVRIAVSEGKKKKIRYLHRFVLEAFRGQSLPGFEACHIDGNRSNNQLLNLRWDTRKGNHADKNRHGTQPRGERLSNAKLTESVVRLIRRSSLSAPKLARQLGVSKTLIWNVRTFIAWRHVL